MNLIIIFAHLIIMEDSNKKPMYDIDFIITDAHSNEKMHGSLSQKTDFIENI